MGTWKDSDPAVGHSPEVTSRTVGVLGAVNNAMLLLGIFLGPTHTTKTAIQFHSVQAKSLIFTGGLNVALTLIPWLKSHRYVSSTDVRRWEDVRFCPVDPDGDLSTGGAEFLEQSAVGTDPQVLLCDFHLKQSVKNNPG